MAKTAEAPKLKSLKREPIKINKETEERIMAQRVLVISSLPRIAPRVSNWRSVKLGSILLSDWVNCSFWSEEIFPNFRVYLS